MLANAFLFDGVVGGCEYLEVKLLRDLIDDGVGAMDHQRAEIVREMKACSAAGGNMKTTDK